jgi:hypothetical protein
MATYPQPTSATRQVPAQPVRQVPTRAAAGQVPAQPRPRQVPAQPAARQAQAQPTASNVEAALRVQAMHRRVCVPEPVCRWCLKSWPCPGERWAEQVLLRAEEAKKGGDRGRH